VEIVVDKISGIIRTLGYSDLSEENIASERSKSGMQRSKNPPDCDAKHSMPH
jgi:hypothetical protein